jgi:hypothetical protein
VSRFQKKKKNLESKEKTLQSLCKLKVNKLQYWVEKIAQKNREQKPLVIKRKKTYLPINSQAIIKSYQNIKVILNPIRG